MQTTRRQFLHAALAGSAAAGAALWLPRRARAGNAPIKRLVVLYGYGGIRWSATFDGQDDVKLNPWKTLNWDTAALKVLPAYDKVTPQFKTGRLLVQKPLPFDDTESWPSVLTYLTDQTKVNLNRSVLSSAWGGAQLPNYLDVVANGDVSVVRVTNNTNGQPDTDYGSASRTLARGYPSGQTGLTTALHYGLQKQLQGAFATTYALPAVHAGGWGWDLGVGQYASYRPLTLTEYSGVTSLPKTDPGTTVSTWGRAAETRLDAAFQASRNALAGQDVGNFMNDKANEHYVGQLIDPALSIADPKTLTAALGTLVGGGAPVTNAMLAELFGLSAAVTPASDILFDVFASRTAGMTAPTWAMTDNQEGLVGAQVVRLLQKGAPIVSVAYGNYDSHSKEVRGTSSTHDSCTSSLVALGRTLAALSFALKQIADPDNPTMKASLWDSTVVVVTSEFGRSFDSPDGFYSQTDGGGSEHGSWCGWPVMGGPLAKGGVLLDDGMNGRATHQNRVFTTLMQGMGIQDMNSPYLAYSDFPVIGGLITGVM